MSYILYFWPRNFSRWILTLVLTKSWVCRWIQWSLLWARAAQSGGRHTCWWPRPWWAPSAAARWSTTGAGMPPWSLTCTTSGWCSCSAAHLREEGRRHQQACDQAERGHLGKWTTHFDLLAWYDAVAVTETLTIFSFLIFSNFLFRRRRTLWCQDATNQGTKVILYLFSLCSPCLRFHGSFFGLTLFIWC